MRRLLISVAVVALLSLPTLAVLSFNPDYFAHPACVMQGVTDRELIYAMPLEGVPELGTCPLAGDVSTSDVTWSATSSDPSLIGTAIESSVLYIWGADSASTGTGSVILTAGSGSGTAAIEIPVVVFQQDKTLVNSEGIKDYLVPWSPQLDINRILSVEEHMEEYGKDDGFLDRSYRWSRCERCGN